ncbi:FAD-dependent oxidoreductase [Aerophototrophica crusticola]|uniref:FAD-dependent oxidoreductase n=1 Tax=Aerophototrophica crusticola TaxID=1709002 RepID=UPI00384B657A
MVIIGAGVAGLAAAAILSARGMEVTLLDRAPAPGGKMREVAVGTTRQDAGPTVLTLRPVLEELFQAAGSRLSDHVTLTRADILARHAWDPGLGAGTRPKWTCSPTWTARRKPYPPWPARRRGGATAASWRTRRACSAPWTSPSSAARSPAWPG